jgi:hypothetical protein
LSGNVGVRQALAPAGRLVFERARETTARMRRDAASDAAPGEVDRAGGRSRAGAVATWRAMRLAGAARPSRPSRLICSPPIVARLALGRLAFERARETMARMRCDAASDAAPGEIDRAPILRNERRAERRGVARPAGGRRAFRVSFRRRFGEGRQARALGDLAKGAGRAPYLLAPRKLEGAALGARSVTPFSEMNSTPSVSSATRKASTVRARNCSPRSNRVTVFVETLAASASCRTPISSAARAIRH